MALAKNPQSVAVIDAVIALAASLDIRVVAEGVECADEQRMLREHGCPIIQGHVFSPASPLAALKDFLAAERFQRSA